MLRLFAWKLNGQQFSAIYNTQISKLQAISFVNRVFDIVKNNPQNCQDMSSDTC